MIFVYFVLGVLIGWTVFDYGLHSGWTPTRTAFTALVAAGGASAILHFIVEGFPGGWS